MLRACRAEFIFCARTSADNLRPDGRFAQSAAGSDDFADFYDIVQLVENFGETIGDRFERGLDNINRVGRRFQTQHRAVRRFVIACASLAREKRQKRQTVRVRRAFSISVFDLVVVFFNFENCLSASDKARRRPTVRRR